MSVCVPILIFSHELFQQTITEGKKIEIFLICKIRDVLRLQLLSKKLKKVFKILAIACLGHTLLN